MLYESNSKTYIKQDIKMEKVLYKLFVRILFCSEWVWLTRAEARKSGWWYIQLKCEWFDCLRVVFITFFFVCTGKQVVIFCVCCSTKKVFLLTFYEGFHLVVWQEKLCGKIKLRETLEFFFCKQGREFFFISLCFNGLELDKNVLWIL